MPKLDAIGVIVSDMARAIGFYRLVGLEFEGDEVHAEAAGPGGLRVMLDSEASVIRSPTGRRPREAARARLSPSSATARPMWTGSTRTSSQPGAAVICLRSMHRGDSATPRCTTTTATPSICSPLWSFDPPTDRPGSGMGRQGCHLRSSRGPHLLRPARGVGTGRGPSPRRQDGPRRGPDRLHGRAIVRLRAGPVGDLAGRRGRRPALPHPPSTRVGIRARHHDSDHRHRLVGICRSAPSPGRGERDSSSSWSMT